MEWLKLSIFTTPEGIEPVSGRLYALGINGIEIEDEKDFLDFLENNREYWDYVDDELSSRFAGVSRIKCYLVDDEDGRAILRSLRERYQGLQVSYVEDSDWENNWREFYKPIPVGEKLVVVPEWEPIPEDGRLALRLDPGLIFGTGSHATTQMCLAALERFVTPETRVLDLGCGSGILGIGALVLGARSCLGCDIDPKAPDVVRMNAALNGIGPDRLSVCAGDILTDQSLRRSFGGGYDLVLANIVSDVILPLSRFVRDFMKPEGVFICSGIIEGRQDEVRSALLRAGLRILEHRSQEDWHCFVTELA